VGSGWAASAAAAARAWVCIDSRDPVPASVSAGLLVGSVVQSETWLATGVSFQVKLHLMILAFGWPLAPGILKIPL
jgi:hypothetical protein